MLEFILTAFDTIKTIIENVSDTLFRTIDYIDSVDFQNNSVTEMLGYVRYLLGDINYFALTTFFVAGLGISVWKIVLSMIGNIKNLLPW